MRRKSSRRLRAAGLALMVLLVVALLVINLLHLAPAVLTRTTPLVPQEDLPTVGAVQVTVAPPLGQDPVTAEDAEAALGPVFESFPAAAGHVTGSVVDVASGDQVFSRSGDDPGTPASSLKTLTAAAALSVLGEDRTVATSTYSAAGDVVLVGGGDVLLTPERLAVLAADTAAALPEGPDSGEAGPVQVVLEDTLFDGSTLSPHWDESLLTSNNIAPVMPIAMFAARASAASGAPRVSDPAMTAALAFRDALAAELGEGRVVAEVVRGDRGESAEPLARLVSPTIGEMVEVMTQHSENYVAETLGRLVAIELGQPASFGGVAHGLNRALERMGIDTAGASIVDASGLAAANQVTPEQLALMMAAVTTAGHEDLRDVSYLLPIAGATGTMANRLGTEQTLGRVRAKTGTLAGVVTLTGLAVTENGRLVAFSFFARDVPGSLGAARAELDRAAAALTTL
ncbi:D-alanyl-D-alanine carboxypeptidase/D-alanyl-D-alanine-endopeptidase [Zhihengliuella sp.]|uniref:D-alanyl-D-alanine carboxypeptidase/D-alanyl-D-alanine endopeptidase n=1 Tax=Zhihengliuella sp. TaxID=1954483 RepID=UPI00281238DB|nr:D-alanyl-D-alanine carboxypeptidase/D-alanyl-D-alanine-endopeptidase [Zhihengliuella sp.]